MTALLLCLAAALAGELRVEVRSVDGDSVVDAAGTSVAPEALLRRLADGSGRKLRGEALLAGADSLDVHLEGRALDSVLRALALATSTSIVADAHVIAISPARERAKLEDLELEAQAAWLRLVRDFPDHEAARAARFELGRVQERLGREAAALAHYDAAVRTDIESPAMERALQAASDLLLRRGEWGEAQRRLSQLAVHASDESLRCSARIATARALAMQGRGPEAIGLLDAVDLSFPPRDDREAEERRLVRARAELAAGNAPGALAELDRRAAAHASFGLTSEDLELRARALDAVGATLEASRAWLACASLSSGRAREDALAAASRLAHAGGDELAVLFIARLAEAGTADGAERGVAQRLASEATFRLGLDDTSTGSVAELERRWKQRARLTPSDRVALAARCIGAVARGRSVEDAAAIARTALGELDGADPAPVRAALATSYERRGMWSQAARVWSGGDL